MTNTANAPLSDIILKGNTSQQQYSGKNLFDKSKALLGYWIGNEQGDAEKGPNDVFLTDFIPVFKNVPVYIPATGTARREFYNKNKVGITYLHNQNAQVFTPTEDGFIRVTCRTGTVTMDSLMLNYGTTETEYEPYVGGTASPNPDYPQEIKVVTGDNTITISNSDNTEKQELPISLGSLELCKIGNYQDYIYKNNGKWYKHKKVEKLILNGSNYVFYLNESTELPNPTYHRFITFFSQNGLKSGIVNCYSNKFKNTTADKLWGNDISGIAQSQTQFIIRTNKVSNDNEIKTWLSQNNLTGYFSLTTPTEEEITDTTLISQLNELEKAVSYDDTTNISQTNANLPFIINAEAFKKIS